MENSAIASGVGMSSTLSIRPADTETEMTPAEFIAMFWVPPYRSDQRILKHKEGWDALSSYAQGSTLSIRPADTETAISA